MVRWPGHPCRPVRAGRPSVRSRPRERSTSSSRSSPRPRHQTGKRSERSSLAENVTNSAQQEEICKIHQMPRERSTYRSRSSPRPPDLAGTRWIPLLSGGESHQFCITGSRKCAKSAKWAIYLTVLVFSRLSIGRILHISSCLQACNAELVRFRWTQIFTQTGRKYKRQIEIFAHNIYHQI